jgi:hypothetical protein
MRLLSSAHNFNMDFDIIMALFELSSFTVAGKLQMPLLT